MARDNPEAELPSLLQLIALDHLRDPLVKPPVRGIEPSKRGERAKPADKIR